MFPYHCNTIEGLSAQSSIETEHWKSIHCGKPKEKKDWGFVNTIRYSIPSDVNIEGKQYDVSF